MVEVVVQVLVVETSEMEILTSTHSTLTLLNTIWKMVEELVMRMDSLTLMQQLQQTNLLQLLTEHLIHLLIAFYGQLVGSNGTEITM